MGLFDGVKDAFSAPALERSTLDAERETPIDRWFGWSVARDEDGVAAASVQGELVKQYVFLVRVCTLWIPVGYGCADLLGSSHFCRSLDVTSLHHSRRGFCRFHGYKELCDC